MENTFLGKIKSEEGSPRNFNTRKEDYAHAVERIKEQIEERLGRAIDPNKDVVVGFKTAVFRQDKNALNRSEQARSNALTDHQQLQLVKVLRSYFPNLQEDILLPGEDEAKHFYAGTYSQFVQQYPEANGKKVVAIDLGGGSTEFTVGKSTDALELESLNYGDTNHQLGKGSHYTAEALQTIREGAKTRAEKLLSEKTDFSKPD